MKSNFGLKYDLDISLTDCEIHPRAGVKCCTDVIPHSWAADGQRFKLTPLTSKHIF